MEKDIHIKIHHNYCMETLQDVLIVAGITSVGLLWVFSIAGAFQTLWDTFGDCAERLLERIKR